VDKAAYQGAHARANVSGLSAQLGLEVGGAALGVSHVPPEVDEGWRGGITASPESLSPGGNKNATLVSVVTRCGALLAAQTHS
jgi:hypothetical protein